MPLQLLLTPAACAAVTPASVAFSRPRPSRLRGSQVPSAFSRLRKYGRRRSEPVAAPTFDDDDEESDAEEDDEDDEEEEAVDEEEFLATRPKPVGFGVGRTYSTDIEEQLLREMGGAATRRKGETSPAKRRAGSSSVKETSADLSDSGVQVRVWNLPKKKNIHKDLKQAFKGFPGLLNINPAVSANKKTRDPICKGFAYLKMESVEAATRHRKELILVGTAKYRTSSYYTVTFILIPYASHLALPFISVSIEADLQRFVEIYYRKNVSFGKVEKAISCCVVDAQSPTEPSHKAPITPATQQPKSMQQLVPTS